MDKKLYCEEIEKIKASNRLKNNIENLALWQEKDKNDRSRKLTWQIIDGIIGFASLCGIVIILTILITNNYSGTNGNKLENEKSSVSKEKNPVNVVAGNDVDEDIYSITDVGSVNQDMVLDIQNTLKMGQNGVKEGKIVISATNVGKKVLAVGKEAYICKLKYQEVYSGKISYERVESQVEDDYFGGEIALIGSGETVVLDITDSFIERYGSLVTHNNTLEICFDVFDFNDKEMTDSSCGPIYTELIAEIAFDERIEILGTEEGNTAYLNQGDSLDIRICNNDLIEKNVSVNCSLWGMDERLEGKPIEERSIADELFIPIPKEGGGVNYGEVIFDLPKTVLPGKYFMECHIINNETQFETVKLLRVVVLNKKENEDVTFYLNKNVCNVDDFENGEKFEFRFKNGDTEKWDKTEVKIYRLVYDENGKCVGKRLADTLKYKLAAEQELTWQINSYTLKYPGNYQLIFEFSNEEIVTSNIEETININTIVFEEDIQVLE